MSAQDHENLDPAGRVPTDAEMDELAFRMLHPFKSRWQRFARAVKLFWETGRLL